MSCSLTSLYSLHGRIRSCATVQGISTFRMRGHPLFLPLSTEHVCCCCLHLPFQSRLLHQLQAQPTVAHVHGEKAIKVGGAQRPAIHPILCQNPGGICFAPSQLCLSVPSRTLRHSSRVQTCESAAGVLPSGKPIRGHLV